MLGKLETKVLLRTSKKAKQSLPKNFSTKNDVTLIAKKILQILEVQAELSVLLTDDIEIRELNSKYRKKNKPTDVLSFPVDLRARSYLLGDIVISVSTAKRQARLWGIPFKEEMKRLLVHGILHLLGYEHEKVSSAVSARMRRRERQVLAQLV